MHGAGGVALTSPEGVSAYGGQKVSLQSTHNVSIKSGWSASIKSAGNAKLFGMASAQVASQGVVGIKGRVISISANLAEVKAEEVLALNGKRMAKLESDADIVIDAPTVGVAADNVNVEGGTRAVLRGRADADVMSDERVRALVGQSAVEVRPAAVELHAQQANVKIEPGTIALGHGATAVLTAEADGVRIGRCFEARPAARSVRINGTVYLG